MDIFQLAFDASPDALLVVDMQGLILRVSSQVREQLGYEPGELLGRGIELLVPERFQAEHRAQREAYGVDPKPRPMGMGRGLFARRKDGRELPVDIMLSPLHSQGETSVLCAMRELGERTEREHLQQALREKDLLLKEVHHRVKNNLAVISSMFYLQSTYTPDLHTIQILRECQERVRCIAQVHERLYRSETSTSIDFGDYARGLCQDLFQSYASGRRGVRLRLMLSPVHLGLNAAVPCGLVLNELVTNALLHAFPDGHEGEVSVSVEAGPNAHCILRVRDTGVGLSPAARPHEARSLGLRLIRALVGQLEGEFELASCAPGTEARVSFPVGAGH